MLAARDLSLALSGRRILHGITCDLRPGELTAVVGPNGAGKSSLLKALTGLLNPTQGEALLDRKPLATWRPAELARRRAVLVQSPETAFPFTVHELVALGARAAGNAGNAAAEVARGLAEVDLSGYGDRLVQELSGGERQRAHIARVLCQLGARQPGAGERWLFLDEPTNGLDIAHQLRILDLAKTFARSGGGVMAILHDLTLASLYADRILLLDQGRLIGDGPPREVLSAGTIGAVFGDRLKLIVDAGESYIVPTGPSAKAEGRLSPG